MFHPLGFPAVAHLVLFGFLLPAAAWRSRDRLSRRPLPPRAQHFASVIFQQGVFLAVSLVVARSIGIDPLGTFVPTAGGVGLALSMLGLAVLAFRPGWKRQVADRERRIHLVAPRTATERLIWVGISVAAGIGEEITYRGVLFAIIGWMTGSVAFAVVLCSMAFGAGHLIQGWRGAAAITVFAAAFHGLVWFTGSLHLAIAVHTLYDIIAGWSYGAFADRSGFPLTDSLSQTPS